MTIDSACATAAVSLSVRFLNFPNAVCFNEGVDPEVFHPKVGGGYDAAVAYAKTFCDRCEDRLGCLEWALEYDERGVWGGLSDLERRAIRRGRKPITCRSCGGLFPDPGKPGPKPKWCQSCRARRLTQ